MKRWESLVDKLIKEVIGDGNISHLPGAGKPIDLNDDPNTPDELRVTFKIMRDHNVAPDWMMTAHALEQLEDKLHKQIMIRASRFVRQLKDIQRRGTIIEEMKLEEDWKTFVEDFTERVGRYNKEVLLYNIKVPDGIPHKQILIAEKLIKLALEKAET